MRSSPYNPRLKSPSVSDNGAMSTLMESTYKYHRIRCSSLFESLETRTRRIAFGRAIEVLGIDDGVAKIVEYEKASKRASERRSALDGTTSSDSIDSERVEAAWLAADRVSTYAEL